MGNSRSSSCKTSGSGEGKSRNSSRAATNAEDREAAAQLSGEVADKNMQAGGNAISARDLMDDDDGPSSALEEFKALHHPKRKAAEKLILMDGLRKAEQRKMRQHGHLVNDLVGFMAISFSPFGSTVRRAGTVQSHHTVRILCHCWTGALS